MIGGNPANEPVLLIGDPKGLLLLKGVVPNDSIIGDLEGELGREYDLECILDMLGLLGSPTAAAVAGFGFDDCCCCCWAYMPCGSEDDEGPPVVVVVVTGFMAVGLFSPEFILLVVVVPSIEEGE